MQSLKKIISDSRLITFVGTGGVGKTSLSVATAIEAARSGRRVAAITVDPSRRLSDLMGLDINDGNGQSFSSPELPNDLTVFQVDTEKVFRRFVSENMGEEFFRKMEKNKIYQQISKNLRETHNFAAIYQMVEVLKSDQFDLVVLDTPPCEQVLEFFEAPNRLQNFFSPRQVKDQASWINWVQKKGIQAVEVFFSNIVGKEFVKEMDSFFSVVGQLRNSIHDLSKTFMASLSDPGAELFVTFSPALDKVADAQYLSSEIAQKNYSVTGYLLNRAYVSRLDQGQELTQSTDSVEERIYHFMRGQQERSQNTLASMKSGAPKQVQHFAMVPELNSRLESKTDLLDFTQKVSQEWVDL